MRLSCSPYRFDEYGAAAPRFAPSFDAAPGFALAGLASALRCCRLLGLVNRVLQHGAGLLLRRLRRIFVRACLAPGSLVSGVAGDDVVAVSVEDDALLCRRVLGDACLRGSAERATLLARVEGILGVLLTFRTPHSHALLLAVMLQRLLALSPSLLLGLLRLHAGFLEHLPVVLRAVATPHAPARLRARAVGGLQLRGLWAPHRVDALARSPHVPARPAAPELVAVHALRQRQCAARTGSW